MFNSLNPYIVKVGVCKTNRICYDPIDHYEEVPAYMNNNGDEVLMLPRGHLKPGVRIGNTPVIAPKNMKPINKGGSNNA